ncbi:MAG: putative major capsid protein [Prokaryotic dsDNA virus sp.]|nr:MAG: putative major capsid protein [Prokaryotic dsDNA virus sp.]|tara:strand:- start:11301 stop:12242 length:942 start_codon:yes stop_codon:yes gene_type:complete
MPEFVNLDAGETLFFQRELEHRKSQTYDVVKAPLKAFELFPVDSTAGAGAESIAYEQYDITGMAKIIANYADDLPRADVKGKEFVGKIRSVGNSYGYSLQEVRAARMAGKSLEQRKANAAARTQRELWNSVAFYGDETHGLPGFLTNPNIPASSAPNGAGGTPEWSTKTPDEILIDMNALANGIISRTNGAETPNTMVLPIDQYTLISTTPRSSTSDTTILEYFLQNSPFITSVEWANELTAEQLAANGVTDFSGDVAFVYRRDPDVLTLEMPQMFEQLPAQERGLEYVVPCHSRIAGVLVYYPLACAFLDDI